MNASLVTLLANHPVAPLSEADHHALAIAEWLLKEGYTPAATVLKAVVKRRPIVELTWVRAHQEVRDQLGDTPCRIYSGEWGAYWRANGAGYAGSALEAGIYPFADAYQRTFHCGPEKWIMFEVLDQSVEAAREGDLPL